MARPDEASTGDAAVLALPIRKCFFPNEQLAWARTLLSLRVKRHGPIEYLFHSSHFASYFQSTIPILLVTLLV